jgi:hypothetical protein
MNYFLCVPAYNQSAVPARPQGFQQLIQEGQYLC